MMKKVTDKAKATAKKSKDYSKLIAGTVGMVMLWAAHYGVEIPQGLTAGQITEIVLGALTLFGIYKAKNG